MAFYLIYLLNIRVAFRIAFFNFCCIFAFFRKNLVSIIRYINIKKARMNTDFSANMRVFGLVPVVGVEPTRYRYHGILSPARLPILGALDTPRFVAYDLLVVSFHTQDLLLL